MKIRIAIAALALLLAGCQIIAQYELRTGDTATAQVAVIDNILVVGREPMIVTRAKGQSATATWSLPSGGQFSGNGIVIRGRSKDLVQNEPGKPRVYRALPALDTKQVELIRCSVANERRATVTCTIPPQVAAGVWVYDVIADTPAGRITLDPTFMLD